MEPVLPPFHNPFRRRLAFFTDLFTKLLVRLKPGPRDFGSQRMCPFCGLITSRSKRLCLECGKSLRGVSWDEKMHDKSEQLGTVIAIGNEETTESGIG